MDVNYDISSDYVQRQTDHGIVVLSIIRVFRTASPGSPHYVVLTLRVPDGEPD